MPLARTLFSVATAALLASPALAQNFPSKPVELICTTSPGSSIAVWCQLLGAELQKPEYLGVPVNVIFKSGGSQHEPVVYVANKPADGHTLMHVSASFYGYFHLPHYTKTYDDFEMLARVETHMNGIGVRCDNAEGIKSWNDLVAYAKKHPNRLAMGSNKIGSNHHRHQVALFKAAGIAVRFVPYEGDGDTVKDVIGNHLKVGMASPRTWRPHIEAKTVCPLLMLNEERLTRDSNWKDVPSVREVGLNYDIVHQWQGFMVKRGTPPEISDKLAATLKKVTEGAAYQDYLAKGTHIVPTFVSDRKWLDDDMRKHMGPTRAFMVENKIIKQ